MQFLVYYLAALGLSAMVGHAFRVKRAGSALNYVAFVLIYFIGNWAGSQVRSTASVLGVFVSAFEIFLPSVVVAYALAFAVEVALGKRTSGPKRGRAKRSKVPYFFLLAVSLGWISGAFFPIPRVEDVVYSFLIVLSVVVGLDMGGTVDMESLKRQARNLWLPVCAMAGAVIGGGISALLFGFSVRFAVASSLGMGWYSLTGPVVSSYMGPRYGAIAFFANFIREQATFLLVPLVGGDAGESILTLGASTTMDDTLSLYMSALGDENKLIIFFNGFIISLLIPFLVPLALTI